MASHTETQKSNPALNFIAGIVFIAVGAYFADSLILHLPGGIPWNLAETLATIGILLILFPVVKTFYTKPLGDAIEERNSNLERTFTEAEELRARMDQMRGDYEKRLAATEAEAREKIQAQIKEAQALRQKLESDAVSRADEMVRRAQEEIQAERNRVMTELRLEVVNLTLGATEKLLGENMDTEKNRRLVNDFINKVEVPS